MRAVGMAGNGRGTVTAVWWLPTTEGSGAEGILFCAASFCDPALLDRPMLRAGAEAEGIPCIAFKYSENTGQFQQFREQAGTFADAIKLWGGSPS